MSCVRHISYYAHQLFYTPMPHMFSVPSMFFFTRRAAHAQYATNIPVSHIPSCCTYSAPPCRTCPTHGTCSTHRICFLRPSNALALLAAHIPHAQQVLHTPISHMSFTSLVSNTPATPMSYVPFISSALHIVYTPSVFSTPLCR